LGAFFVPEPLGACLVIAAGIWWLWQKPFGRDRQAVARKEGDSAQSEGSHGFAVAEPATGQLGKSG